MLDQFLRRIVVFSSDIVEQNASHRLRVKLAQKALDAFLRMERQTLLQIINEQVHEL